jgi:hypothetical protein
MEAIMTDQEQDHSNWDFSWDSDSPTRRWMTGLVLIFVGAILLLVNLTGNQLHNWWALFILSPAINSFSRAVDIYRSRGNIDRSVIRHAFWGVFFVVLSATFLLEYSFGLVWPVFLILGGIALLFGAW